MSAIKVSNLSKKFKELTAVDGISFDVPYGKVTALLGSNGAGKSTTLNMIAGILEPSSGAIEFTDLTFEKDYKKIKSKLGYLTCDMALYPTFSVRETLKLLGDLKGFSNKRTKERISQLSKRFDLSEILDKFFTELSSGQKQKSLIAASVFHDPEILIFDEVTASLDLIVSKEIMDFLIEEKDKGKAILFSTHILSEVEYISDRILMIEKGNLVKETTHRELIAEGNSKNITEAFYRALKEVA